MKRATGNNPLQANIKVSIQQSLDGHSFSVPALSEAAIGDAPVEVELLLPRTMLVPEELFDAERAAELLAANGTPAAAGEGVAVSGPEEGRFALTAVSGDLLREIRATLGERARFTTPLLRTPAATAKTVWICRKGGITYIKIYDQGALRFAEAFRAADDTDLLYFAERLNGLFPLQDYDLHVAGEEPRRLLKLFGKRFREAVCE